MALRRASSTCSVRKLDRPFADGGGIFEGQRWHPLGSVDVGLLLKWGDEDQCKIVDWANINALSLDGLLILSALRARHCSTDRIAIEGLLQAEARGCVAASYELGRAFESAGRAASASAAYARAAASGHIGGIVGLYCQAERNAQATRAICLEMATAAARPDALELAQHLGCVSLIADAAWISAEFLRFDGRSPDQIFAYRSTGGRPNAPGSALSVQIERLLSVGERVGDCFCALGRIEERIGLCRRTLQSRGLLEMVEYNFGGGAAGEAAVMCATLYAWCTESSIRSHVATVAADLAERGALGVDAYVWHKRAADEESPTNFSLYKVFLALDKGLGVPRDVYAACG